MTRASLLIVLAGLAALAGCGAAYHHGDCRDATPCEDRGIVCFNLDERCTCEVGSGLTWQCEPGNCPEEDAIEGEPCEPEGLVCDTGFEDEGNRCVGPELVWAPCYFYHQGERSGCPGSAPTVGAPCCKVPSALTSGCVYGADVYDCVGDHWTGPST